MIYLNGLAVIAAGSSGCPVSCMCDRHCTLREGRNRIPGKHFTYKAKIFMRYKQAIIIYNNSAAFLTPVLQGI